MNGNGFALWVEVLTARHWDDQGLWRPLEFDD